MIGVSFIPQPTCQANRVTVDVEQVLEARAVKRSSRKVLSIEIDGSPGPPRFLQFDVVGADPAEVVLQFEEARKLAAVRNTNRQGGVK